jgi:hypothetical protein
MLNVMMLSANILSTIMLSVTMLSAIMLSANMLSVTTLNVVAPTAAVEIEILEGLNTCGRSIDGGPFKALTETNDIL